MICVDTKFFSHVIDCLEMQKHIHLRPMKEKIMWQDRIDKTVQQCRGLVEEAVAEEKKIARKKALGIIPDKSMFDDTTISMEDYTEG